MQTRIFRVQFAGNSFEHQLAVFGPTILSPWTITILYANFLASRVILPTREILKRVICFELDQLDDQKNDVQRNQQK